MRFLTTFVLIFLLSACNNESVKNLSNAVKAKGCF